MTPVYDALSTETFGGVYSPRELASGGTCSGEIIPAFAALFDHITPDNTETT